MKCGRKWNVSGLTVPPDCGILVQKLAIFDEKEQYALLGACEGDNEFVPIWLMMRCGMHPSDVAMAREKFRFNDQGKVRFLEWSRVKNAKPRREIVPDDIRPRLERWLAKGRKLTREGYFQLVRRVGARIGHPEYSPQTLRHTFCLQELRRFMRQNPPPPDPISLVAQKMGCTVAVVRQNYIDMLQWEALGGPSNDGQEGENASFHSGRTNASTDGREVA